MAPVKQRISADQADPTDQKILETADKLHSAAIHLLRRLRVRDRESGIGPAQLSALSVLVFGGPRSLGELADAEQVRAPTMSRIVSGLERAKLVKRHATEDGRRVRLEATARGTRILQEGRRRRVESLAQALSLLLEEDRQRLAEMTSLLQQVIREL
jgi:DNA-binding MarR family transcriptional regulator